MRIPMIAASMILALAAACSAPATNAPSAGSGGVAAVWETDEDANLAFPICPTCGEVVDRGTASCAHCTASVRVEPKTVSCPECQGSKTCVHCGPGHVCVACEGTHVCQVCDGTGTFDGTTCPECGGAKTCRECAAATEVCERCAGTHVCANCGGTGEITLE